MHHCIGFIMIWLYRHWTMWYTLFHPVSFWTFVTRSNHGFLVLRYTFKWLFFELCYTFKGGIFELCYTFNPVLLHVHRGFLRFVTRSKLFCYTFKRTFSALLHVQPVFVTHSFVSNSVQNHWIMLYSPQQQRTSSVIKSTLKLTFYA